MYAEIFIFFIAKIIYSTGGTDAACSERSKSFNQCIEDALNKLLPLLGNGWNNRELPGIDPIVVPPANASHINETMDITLWTKGVIITGLSSSKVHAVKSKNLYMGKLEVVIKAPRFQIKGNYRTEGEIATFPLSSSGHFIVNMDDVTLVCIVYLERYGRGEKGRLYVKSISLDAVPGQISIKPAPYLDGDENLGQTLEIYLNENSYELYNMVKIPLMNYISNLARIIINSYMAEVPENQLIES